MIRAVQPAPDLAWIGEITSHPHWPKMEALFFQEGAIFLNDSLVISKSATLSRGTQDMLKKCGLTVPTSHEEEVRVYLCLRAVLGYLTEKKKQIEMLKKAHMTNVERGLKDGTLARETQTTLKGH